MGYIDMNMTSSLLELIILLPVTINKYMIKYLFLRYFTTPSQLNLLFIMKVP
jgi:hypothetical protein